MPVKLEKELRAKAQEKFPNDVSRQNAYIYGTMRKTGWKRKNEKHE